MVCQSEKQINLGHLLASPLQCAKTPLNCIYIEGQIGAFIVQMLKLQLLCISHQALVLYHY